MAEGFDDFEAENIDIGELENYNDSQLSDHFNEISEKRDSLYKRYGDNEKTPELVRVEYGKYNIELKIIEEERDRREERETTFVDNDDGKTVTIKKLDDPIEAPSDYTLTNYHRNITFDKKGNIKRILGMDHQFRVKDGKNSKGLLKNSTVVFNSKSDKVIGLDYKGERVYVSDDGGKSYRQTTNKKNQDNLEEFESVREKATEEYNKFEEEKQNYPLVDTTPKTGDIHGLTPKENSELRGVLTPNKSIDPTTRSEFLKVQADHLQETINETREINENNYLEGSELGERVTGLEEARDRTLEQLEIEETRESQEEDVSRLIRFKEWAKENIAGLAAIVISIAGIITTIIVSARKLITRGVQATSKFAKALYKTFKDIAEKLGPILGPVLSAIGSLLSAILKYGAKGIAWLAQNLWALVIALAYLIYSQYKKK